MRFIGMDVHRDFCEVAIWEAGEVRSAGRVKSTEEDLELFAGSLGEDDQVAMEMSGALPSPRHLVGYLGLDPKVAQSGSEPARHGRISKRGPATGATSSSRPRCTRAAPPGR